MRIQTVLDCRPCDPKFYCSILLLAASWAQHVKSVLPLRVVMTGEAPLPLLRFFDELGVSWQTSEPDADLAFVPTGNTLLGGLESGQHDRIMLVDNDVYFLGDLMELSKIEDDVLAGAPAGQQRITQTQWGLIKSDLGLTPLKHRWISRKEQLKNLKSQGDQPDRINQTYINGGVLLLPNDERFMDLWRTNILRIDALFRGTAHQTDAVCRSNMVGLATAAGAHAKFQWLDDTFNYRHLHVLLNLAKFEDISIVHLTGYPKYDGHIREKKYVSDYVHLYWKHRVTNKLVELESIYDPARLLSVKRTIKCSLAAMLDTIHAHDLDGVMEELMANDGRKSGSTDENFWNRP